MKKILIVVLILCLGILLLAGCSNDDGMTDNRANGIDIDIDMAAMSTTMAQATFHNIIEQPTDFLGYVIRASGPYFSFYWDQAGIYNHFVMIVFGDECCRMGFEFRLPDHYVYPDDFPPQLTPIEVTGLLSRYELQGSGFIYLAVDELIILG